MLVLCFPIASESHLNVSLGLALAIRKRGHQVVYVVERKYVGRFAKYGFEEKVYDEFSDAGGSWEEVVESLLPKLRLPPKDATVVHLTFLRRSLEGIRVIDDRLENIINEVKPDVIVKDMCTPHAAFNKCDIPVVYQCPMNPLWTLENENLPPRWIGASFTNPDKEMWKAYRQKRDAEMEQILADFNEYLTSRGAEPVDFKLKYISKHLNILMYPTMLLDHYLKLFEPGPEWFGVDHAIRPCEENFKIPEKLKSLPGKLIFLSMGTLGSADVELMKLLVKVLGETRHRYIVTMGANHDKYELAINMWGAKFLPQLAVLQVVDLFITHGGNNSFTEGLYYGKPLVVIPLFTDQIDNATMAEEAEIGAKFMPFLEPEENLVQKLEMVLNSSKIYENVRAISQHMQKSDSLNKAVLRIEEVVDKLNINISKSDK